MAENIGTSAPSAPTSTAPTQTPNGPSEAKGNPGAGLKAGVTGAAASAEKTNPNEAPKTPATETRKYKVKIGGQEREISENELLKGYSLAEGANQRFEEAARMRRQAEQFAQALTETPAELLVRKHGPAKARQIMEQFLAQEYQREAMSPAERRAWELEQELRRRDEEAQFTRRQQEQQEFERTKAEFAQNFQKQIQDALQGGGLPKNEWTVKRMAALMRLNRNHKIGLEPQQLVELVREDYIKEISALLSASDGETTLKLLGDDVANKIRKADLARIRAKTQPAVPSVKVPSTPVTQQGAKAEEKPLTLEEFRARVSARVNS